MDTPIKKSNIVSRTVHFLYLKLLRPKSATEDDQRREFILNIILASTILLFFFVCAFILEDKLESGSRYEGAAPTYFIIAFLIFLCLYLFSRAGYFVFAAYALITVYFVAIIFGIFNWGVDLPTIILSYALIIFMAGILINTRVGIWCALLVFSLVIGFSYLQSKSLMHLDSRWRKEPFRMFDVLGYIIVLLFILIISWLSNREAENALQRARKSEQELKKERDSLEINVEERTKEIKRMQMEKMSNLYRFAEIGKMSAGFFHDIINHLTNVSLYMGQLHDVNFNEVADAKNYAEQAYENSKRMENFIVAIQKQIQVHETENIFNLRDEIKQVLEVLNYKAKKSNIRIDFIYAQPLEAFGNHIKFHQAMLNIISNAIDAYEDIADDRERQILIDLSREKESIQIIISDNASGISEENLPKIFEPFFTTKSAEKGTGIGLANTKNIIENSFQGSIDVRSQPMQGTTFTIKFIPFR